MNRLVDTVKAMATACHLQNCEQITEENGAIGAVVMIQYEYLDLLDRYLRLKKESAA